MSKIYTVEFHCLDGSEGTITASENDLLDHPVAMIDEKLFLRNYNEREDAFTLVEVVPLVASADR